MGSIESFGKLYQVTRYAAGQYITGGKWQDGPVESEHTMTACIQPLGEMEQVNQPDGIRTRELIKIYTRFPLRAAMEDLKVRGDRFQYCGRTYEVVRIANWGIEVGSVGDLYHFKAIAALVEDSARV